MSGRDFAGEHLLTYDVERDECDLFRLFLDPAGAAPARWSRVPLTEAILEMTRAGLGVTVLARWAVADAARGGTLVVRPLRPRRLARAWHAVIRPDAAQDAVLRSLLRLLRETRPLHRAGKSQR